MLVIVMIRVSLDGQISGDRSEGGWEERIREEELKREVKRESLVDCTRTGAAALWDMCKDRGEVAQEAKEMEEADAYERPESNVTKCDAIRESGTGLLHTEYYNNAESPFHGKVPGLLQGIFLVEALYEVGLVGGNISLHHALAGSTWNGVELPVIFPRRMVQFCSCGVSGIVKNVSFVFVGMHTARRAWTKEYEKDPNSVIRSTNSRGELMKAKVDARYDWDYLALLRSAKFALIPDGDFIWTYRFFESVACGCLPILPREAEFREMEPTHVGYHACYHGQACDYEQKALVNNSLPLRENFERFVRQHTLTSERVGELYKASREEERIHRE
jgi:hypothetical protein